MSSTLEPAIWSCDTGQRTPCLTAVNQEMIPQYYFNESVNVKIKEIAMPRTPRMLIKLEGQTKPLCSVTVVGSPCLSFLDMGWALK